MLPHDCVEFFACPGWALNLWELVYFRMEFNPIDLILHMNM